MLHQPPHLANFVVCWIRRVHRYGGIFNKVDASGYGFELLSSHHLGDDRAPVKFFAILILPNFGHLLQSHQNENSKPTK